MCVKTKESLEIYLSVTDICVMYLRLCSSHKTEETDGLETPTATSKS